MTIYQKAIKVRKVCESRTTCKDCEYLNHCIKCELKFLSPIEESLETLANVIKKEKWNVK